MSEKCQITFVKRVSGPADLCVTHARLGALCQNDALAAENARLRAEVEERLKEAMDAGYSQGVMDTEARAIKRIDSLEIDLASALKSGEHLKKLAEDANVMAREFKQHLEAAESKNAELAKRVEELEASRFKERQDFAALDGRHANMTARLAVVEGAARKLEERERVRTFSYHELQLAWEELRDILALTPAAEKRESCELDALGYCAEHNAHWGPKCTKPEAPVPKLWCGKTPCEWEEVCPKCRADYEKAEPEEKL